MYFSKVCAFTHFFHYRLCLVEGLTKRAPPFLLEASFYVYSMLPSFQMERVEAKSHVVTEDDCVPETLMALGNGLVSHNKKLKAELEMTKKRLNESQAAHASLLTMNTQ